MGGFTVNSAKSFAAMVLGGAFMLTVQCAFADDIYTSGSRFIRATTQDFAGNLNLAQKGDAEAEFNLGSILLTGVGTTQNFVDALAWFKKSAEQGNPQAQYNLGSMFFTGTATERDFLQAYKWYSLASLNGDPLALSAREDVATKLKPDEIAATQAEAFKWLSDHPIKRQVIAEIVPITQEQQVPTAPILKEKSPFLKEESLLLASWKPDAEKGDAKAQWNVGQMYVTGKGAPRSYAKARNWFIRSAEQGYVPALFSLGEIYSSAKGVDRDFIEAYKWYSLVKSSDSDLSANADRKLAFIESKLNAAQMAKAQKVAQDWLLQRQ